MTIQPAITLIEYVPKLIDKNEIQSDMGEMIWRNYRNQLQIEFPSPKTNQQWEITSLGWVGYIPLTKEWGIQLQPKVDLDNIFRMLEYAYDLESFKFYEGLTHCSSLDEFYDRLAKILARRILDRARKGFYRSYVIEQEQLPYIRGRIDLQHMIHRPNNIRFQCQYEDHTADIEENQILAWTLQQITKSGMCQPQTLPLIRQAYRTLKTTVIIKPFRPRDCLGRLYNRLNDDYQPLHALCRFFLEHSGPSHKIGDRTMLPFLVNMERLYELFVARWLKMHLSDHLSLRIQEKIDVGKNNMLSFSIDLVINETHSNRTLCVLDTKYKIPDKPSNTDISQAVTYAKLKECTTAILIYPQHLSDPLDEYIGDIRIKSMTFGLGGDLENQGQTFLHKLEHVITP